MGSNNPEPITAPPEEGGGRSPPPGTCRVDAIVDTDRKQLEVWAGTRLSPCSGITLSTTLYLGPAPSRSHLNRP